MFSTKTNLSRIRVQVLNSRVFRKCILLRKSASQNATFQKTSALFRNKTSVWTKLKRGYRGQKQNLLRGCKCKPRLLPARNSILVVENVGVPRFLQRVRRAHARMAGTRTAIHRYLGFLGHLKRGFKRLCVVGR